MKRALIMLPLLLASCGAQFTRDQCRVLRMVNIHRDISGCADVRHDRLFSGEHRDAEEQKPTHSPPSASHEPPSTPPSNPPSGGGGSPPDSGGGGNPPDNGGGNPPDGGGGGNGEGPPDSGNGGGGDSGNGGTEAGDR
jgi:hypothetical protein